MKEIKTGNQTEGIQKVNTGQPMTGDEKACALIETMITHPGISYNDAIKITPIEKVCPSSHDPKLNTGHICTNCGFDMLSKTYPEKKELSAEDIYKTVFKDIDRCYHFPELKQLVILCMQEYRSLSHKEYTEALEFAQRLNNVEYIGEGIPVYSFEQVESAYIRARKMGVMDNTKAGEISTREREVADKAIRDAMNYVHDDNNPARNSEYINSHEEIWIQQYLNDNFPLTNKFNQKL